MVEFPNRRNSLLLHVAATEYVNNAAVEFQYFLEGFDENWTPWSTLRSKEYTNLPPGEYTLNIRARNIRGNLSSDYYLNFAIEEPWYSVAGARFLYLLLFLIVG